MREKDQDIEKTPFSAVRAWLARQPAGRLLAGGILLAALAPLTLFSAAGAVSAWLPALEVFGNLQGHFAMAGLGLLATALVLRARGWAIAAAAVFGLNVAAAGIRMVPVAACPVQMAATGHQAVRILSHNISRKNRGPEAFEQLVAHQRPDIIVLQEFEPATAALLDGLRAQYRYHAVCDKNKDCDIAILSRFPLRSRHTVGDDEIVGWQATAIIGTRELVLLGTHVDQPFAGQAQSDQFDTLTRVVAALPDNAIVMGDFNSAPWSANMARYARSAGVCASNTSIGTWPQWLGPFGIPIDHIFLKPGVRLLSIAPLDGTGSDHRALLATVGIH